jgi:uncharacterized protein (DUF488 family)
VSSGSARSRNANAGAIFESEGEGRALLLRMGSGPTAWAYLDTLARSARMSRNALRPKLEALELEDLVTAKEALPARDTD